MTVVLNDIDGGPPVRHSPVGAVNVPKRSGLYRNFFKRGFDIALIIVAAPLILPVIFGLALAVARDGHNPFYWNVRVGKGGKNFKMLKLRTMVPDAERLLEQFSFLGYYLE